MKRLLIALLLVGTPVLCQTPTPTITPTPTVTQTPTITRTPTRTPTPQMPETLRLAAQVRPGYGTFSTEPTVNKLGDTYYATSWLAFGKLAGNITTTMKYLCQQGTGSVSAAPGWCTPLSSISTTAPITGCSSPCTTTATIGITSFATTVPAPGAVPDATAAGAGTFLSRLGTWVVPSGSFTSPLTTKGDLLGYDSATTRVPVGATDGTVLTADSSAALGVSYQYPGVGTLRVLKETVFAGITPASYANGSTTTIDGSGYTCVITSAGGTVDIVAAGLQLRRNTVAGSFEIAMNINPGNTGDFASIVGEARFRRGRWAFWTRMASYNYTNTTAAMYGGSAVSTTYPKWGVALRRTRNLYGTPNTATGGIGITTWWNNVEPAVNFYPGVDTSDVWMAYFRTPEIVDVYKGVYSGGWPTMESMVLMGTIQMQVTQAVSALSGAAGPVASGVGILFQLGQQVASSGTYEIVIDRWRLTTWE